MGASTFLQASACFASQFFVHRRPAPRVYRERWLVESERQAGLSFEPCYPSIVVKTATLELKTECVQHGHAAKER